MITPVYEVCMFRNLLSRRYYCNVASRLFPAGGTCFHILLMLISACWFVGCYELGLALYEAQLLQAKYIQCLSSFLIASILRRLLALEMDPALSHAHGLSHIPIR